MIETGEGNADQPGLAAGPGEARALIDREHLLAFAMGDRALERRFLTLFIEHAVADLGRMSDADPDSFQKIAHSLKSSASSVGAWRVVDCAEQILDLDHGRLSKRRDEMLRALTAQVEATLRHIRQIMTDD
jgi:HPt (histidine-containing phosphotransfer) domain-containing protein